VLGQVSDIAEKKTMVGVLEEAHFAAWDKYIKTISKIMKFKKDWSELLAEKELDSIFGVIDKMDTWLNTVETMINQKSSEDTIFVDFFKYTSSKIVTQVNKFMYKLHEILNNLEETISGSKKLYEWLKQNKMTYYTVTEVFLEPLTHPEEIYKTFVKLAKVYIDHMDYKHFYDFNSQFHESVQIVYNFVGNVRYSVHLEGIRETVSGAPKKFLRDLIRVEKGQVYRFGSIEASWPKRAAVSQYIVYVVSGYLFVVVLDEKKFKFVETFELESQATIKRDLSDNKFTLFLGTTITFLTHDRENWIKDIEKACVDARYIQYQLTESLNDKERENKLERTHSLSMAQSSPSKSIKSPKKKGYGIIKKKK